MSCDEGFLAMETHLIVIAPLKDSCVATLGWTLLPRHLQQLSIPTATTMMKAKLAKRRLHDASQAEIRFLLQSACKMV